MARPPTGLPQALINTAIAQRERLSSGRSQATAAITLLVLAGIGLLLALVAGSVHASGVPTCDSQPMAQDDMCQVFDSRGGGEPLPTSRCSTATGPRTLSGAQSDGA